MKPKTREFADKLINNPKMNQQDAYLATHKTKNKPTARVNASVLMSKPSVQIYLDGHIKKAQRKVVELIGNDKPDIALRASQDVLDRHYGKPLTRNNNLNVNMGYEEALNLLIWNKAFDFDCYTKL